MNLETLSWITQRVTEFYEYAIAFDGDRAYMRRLECRTSEPPHYARADSHSPEFNAALRTGDVTAIKNYGLWIACDREGIPYVSPIPISGTDEPAPKTLRSGP
jgi:hypothetical protein